MLARISVWDEAGEEVIVCRSGVVVMEKESDGGFTVESPAFPSASGPSA